MAYNHLAAIRLLAAIICTALFSCLLAGCGKIDGTELLRWEDQKAGINFTVGSRQRGDSIQCYLEVQQGRKYNSLILADRIDMHRLSMLRYDEWLLVLSGPYVLGGYNYRTNKISPMNAAELPYTLHTLSGHEVAAAQLDDGTDTPPFGFQERRDR